MSDTTTDHETIRKWAQKHGGQPAAVRRTHQKSDTGIIRLEFPDNPHSQHDNLEPISWEEFFDKFEESQLALVYDEKSSFNKIIGRDTAGKREHGEHASRRHPASDKQG